MSIINYYLTFIKLVFFPRTKQTEIVHYSSLFPCIFLSVSPLNIDIRKPGSYNKATGMLLALMVLQVSSQVHWCATGIQALLSLIGCLIDSSVLLPPFLIMSSIHVCLVPRFWHPRLFDHPCLYCSAEKYWGLQQEEGRHIRKGEDREKILHLFVFLSVASCLVGVKLFEGNWRT